MGLDSGQRATEIEFLKACINDLNCVVALPAAWSGGTASQILGTSLDVLRDMLRLDFIYARLKDPTGAGADRNGQSRPVGSTGG